MEKSNEREMSEHPKNPLQKPSVSGHDLDRDKNQTYIPNDESVTEVIDQEGVPKFIHPNHIDTGTEEVPRS